MATPASRIQGWIEFLATAWGKTLGAWAAGFVSGGIERILDIIAIKASAELAPTIARLEAAGIPPELKPILDEIKTPTGELAALSGLGLLNRVVGSIKGDVFAYLTRSITRGFSYSADFYLPDPSLLLDYHLRHVIPDKNDLYSLMRNHGIPPEETDKLLAAKYVRFPSEIVGQLWLRDPVKYAHYWDDVAQNGVDLERIIALKELLYKLPSAQEATTWLAREVFEPEMVRRYGLDDEFGGLDLSLMQKIGITPDMARNYWRAHWSHASWSQVVAMLHRGVIRETETLGAPPASESERARADAAGESAVYDWFRLVEIPPYWRDGLTATMWNVPGRVEARMLAQYGLVDKPFLVELLARDGLAAEYRDVVADMMLVRGIRSDIQTRYTKKWINAAEVRAEINKYGLSPVIADRLYQWIVQNTAGDRTAKEKELTAAEILKGYKRRFTTYDETVAGLVALGYDQAEAAYKIAIDETIVKDEPPPELATQVDTIRRQRRQRIIDRSTELSRFNALNIETALAIAYADNDDMRLVKLPAKKPVEIIPEYLTDDGKVNVETIRLSARQRLIGRLEEIATLIDLEMSPELATAYADNDELRLVKVTGV